MKVIIIKKIWRIIKILAVNLLILFFLMVLLDPLFKIEKPRAIVRNVSLKEHMPNNYFEIAPDDDYLASTENLEKKPYIIRTDNNGFIIGENSSSQNTGPVDLIFFGGSTVECKYVDENLRFPYLVGEKLIDINTGKNIKSLNGGVSGNHSLNSTINLFAKGISLNPKIVFFMHNVNDLNLLTKTGDYWNAPATRSIIQQNRIEPRLTSFLKSSAELFIPNISRLLWISWLNLINKQNDFDEWKGFRHRNIRDFEYEIIEKAFEQAVNSFIAIGSSFDIEVILMTQFNRINPDDLFIKKVLDNNEYYYFNDEDFFLYCNYYKSFNEKIREIAERENLLLIDLAKLVPANNLYIYDPVHLNNRGSELVADIIASELEKNYSFLLKK